MRGWKRGLTEVGVRPAGPAARAPSRLSAMCSEPLLIIYQPFRERFQVGPGIKGCWLLLLVSFLPLLPLHGHFASPQTPNLGPASAGEGEPSTRTHLSLLFLSFLKPLSSFPSCWKPALHGRFPKKVWSGEDQAGRRLRQG